ncbi:hypothetical protein ACET3Z_006387 [Daucus carota]
MNNSGNSSSVSVPQGSSERGPSKPRGRPPGPKNKPKESKRETMGMKPVTLEVQAGVDIITWVTNFANSNQVCITVTAEFGHVSLAVLRYPLVLSFDTGNSKLLQRCTEPEEWRADWRDNIQDGHHGQGSSERGPSKPRGRPPGSKNKPKESKRETMGMKPVTLEVPVGVDIITWVTNFANSNQVCITVTAGFGHVSLAVLSNVLSQAPVRQYKEYLAVNNFSLATLVL